MDTFMDNLTKWWQQLQESPVLDQTSKTNQKNQKNYLYLDTDLYENEFIFYTLQNFEVLVEEYGAKKVLDSLDPTTQQCLLNAMQQDLNG